MQDTDIVSVGKALCHSARMNSEGNELYSFTLKEDVGTYSAFFSAGAVSVVASVAFTHLCPQYMEEYNDLLAAG